MGFFQKTEQFNSCYRLKIEKRNKREDHPIGIYQPVDWLKMLSNRIR